MTSKPRRTPPSYYFAVLGQLKHSHICVRMWDMSALFTIRCTCGFSTFFGISVATNVTVHDARDSLNELSIIALVMQHLPSESKSSTKTSIPCSNQNASLHLGVYAINFRRSFLRMWRFVRDRHVTLALCDSYTKCGDKNMVWVSREDGNLTGKVDLASQRLYLDFHSGGSWSQLPTKRFGERSFFPIACNLLGMM